MEVVTIPIAKVTCNGNIRTAQDDNELPELARSMREDGQVVPISVYPVNGTYVLRFGHRRLAAAKMNGDQTIKAIIETPPEDQIELLLAQYAENEHRKGITYMDKASLYKQIKDLGKSQAWIAEKFGVSTTYVSLALATLRADPKLQQAIVDGLLSPSAIEPMLSLSAEDQAALADAAIAAKTVSKITDLVRANTNTSRKFGDTARQNDGIKDDIDPLEYMILGDIDAALESLDSIEIATMTDRELQAEAKARLLKVISRAQALIKQLDQ